MSTQNQIPEKQTILIAHGDEQTRHSIATSLQDSYAILSAHDDQLALALIDAEPSIVCSIIDAALPTGTGFALTEKLKSHFATHHLPVIIVTRTATHHEMQRAIIAGADDYIQDLALLDVRVLMVITRTKRDQQISPLTRLPGTALTNTILQARLSSPLALLYADLDNFKAYNDTYGFTCGDDVIKKTATIITGVIKKYGNRNDFVGHIGGDDFIVISMPERAEMLAQEITRQFDAFAPNFTPNPLLPFDTPAARGECAALRRVSNHAAGTQGERGLATTHAKKNLSISVTIVTNTTQAFASIEQIAHSMAQAKYQQKQDKRICL